MTSTNDDKRPSRPAVTRSRRAAAANHAAESAEPPRPIPGSWPAAKPAQTSPKPPATSVGVLSAQANSTADSSAATEDAQSSPRPNHRRERHPSEAELARREAVAKFPFVAVSLGASGIHPATSRLISFDAVTYNAAGEIGEAAFMVFSPDSDPGPKHQHGLSQEEVAAGIPFSKALKRVDRILDDRTLIVHDATVTWGFLVSEARRAMTAAARQNRSRNRNSRNRSRRIKVGHIPRPTGIIDTLATARRQELPITDLRLAAVAIASGIAATPPTATVDRAQTPAEETARENTALLWQLHKLQAQRGEVVCLDPAELRADKFGLQRSHIRVDAMEAPRMHHNPGPYVPGRELVRGMEFVVAPEIAIDPDIIIEAAVRQEMNYVEKLSRETSVVVCNVTTDLVGKAMHADRKDIPLMGDEAFLAALERIAEPGPKPEVEERPTTAPRPQKRNPHSSAPARRGSSAGGASSANSSSGKSNNRRRRRRRSGSSNPAHSNAQNQSQGQNQGQGQGGGNQQHSHSDNKQRPQSHDAQEKSPQSQSGPNSGQDSGQGRNHQGGGSKNNNRRRRRGGRGGRNRNRSRGHDNRGADGNRGAGEQKKQS
ncbi:DNA polymerase III subunit epsilon [Corynebacterium ammoniagenes]|uniref:DNA polymerase III subunit epsilon n=1 Tax=Corynebacterium ammoniagenes TaxID=1697 RepID=UPI001981332A|nr:DNA polymerase III subunit epsilon [Corynebacterium ammoniagenes]